MIALYSGTPGSGKSFHAVQRVVNRALTGHKCICNFPVNLDKLRLPGFIKNRIQEPICISNENLTVDYLVGYSIRHSGREGETLLVIDEAGLFFNSRDWNVKGRREWLDFFSQHRKLGFDVILISQSLIMVDKQIRAFIEEDHRHRKLTRMGFFGWFLRPFATFVSVVFWMGSNMRIGAEYIRYNRSYAKCYDTGMIFNNGRADNGRAGDLGRSRK